MAIQKERNYKNAPKVLRQNRIRAVSDCELLYVDINLINNCKLLRTLINDFV